MSEIKIANRKIGPDHPPFIVAEMSGNHNGSLDRALKIIEAVKAAGADAIKFQTYTADTITLNVKQGEFLIDDPKSLWAGKHLYELYQKAHTPWEWHERLFKKCKELDLIAFSSPFDESAVDFLEKLKVPCYKIASLEIVDLPLIQKVAQTGKPLIISTGGATLTEISEALETARHAGCKDIILLKCTTAYPAAPVDSNLRTIPQLAATFNSLVGLSDHTLSLGVPLASIALGCCLIEKHVTLSRKDGGVDSAFSLEPAELEALSKESKIAWQALGKVHFGALPSEKTSLSHRPSLYFVQDVTKGETVQAQHVRSVRPGNGLPPKYLPKIMGLQLAQNVKKGSPVTWDLFKK